MFSRSIVRMRKSISLRIIMLHSIFFAASSVLSFSLFYFLLAWYMEQRDEKILQATLDEHTHDYETGGTQALDNEIRTDRRNDGTIFFVRIAGPDNTTLFLNVPKTDTVVDYKFLERNQLHGRWKQFTTGNDRSATEVISSPLPDGSFLQVGKRVVNRESFLRCFRKMLPAGVIPVILIGFAGGVLLSRRALRSFKDLVDEVDFAVASSLTKAIRASLDNVAHDLLTPITRLRGVIEVALQSEGDADLLRGALMDCAKESDRILTPVNTVMDISAAETGIMILNPQEVSISTLIEEVIELYDCVAEDKDISFSIECPPDLTVRIDRNRMRQVLANLADNAIEYTRPGGKVSFGACANEEEVAISVKDAGAGIPTEDIPRIWDRHYRVDKSRSCHGLGLGLSLVRAIVHSHGGSMKVQSELGRGSVFTIHLPTDSPHPL